jgi:hypothetical protein
MPTTTTTPTIAPATSPDAAPWRETHVSPDEICPQQQRELASPDVEP